MFLSVGLWRLGRPICISHYCFTPSRWSFSNYSQLTLGGGSKQLRREQTLLDGGTCQPGGIYYHSWPQEQAYSVAEMKACPFIDRDLCKWVWNYAECHSSLPSVYLLHEGLCTATLSCKCSYSKSFSPFPAPLTSSPPLKGFFLSTPQLQAYVSLPTWCFISVLVQCLNEASQKVLPFWLTFILVESTPLLRLWVEPKGEMKSTRIT